MTIQTTQKTLVLLRDLEEAPDMDQLRKDMLHLTRETRGFLLGWQAARGDAGAFLTGELSIASRDDYLVFRDRLKAHIRAFAAAQKEHAKAMRQPGGDGLAQWRHADGARIVTQLIALRRASKVWSALQAEARRQVEAAA
ncbi:hypothetical protein LAZ40_09940 [Cereibacter sphaeroides]|uniref:hypothetical protein n=1 Tax=Cereibacter sphaeroides TaxID=1063 RepID=UPI001F31160A|nr:hypothetical protein [Cereibacter sphaeroides]MCE6959372.1 hypothetical protein [Cereibacter sphaeroides]MCE6972964.1 hypothetical protein [Cereibacter sphaeroides]